MRTLLRRYLRSPGWWEKRFLRLEFWTPVLIVAGLAIWGYRYGGNSAVGEILSGRRAELYSTLAPIFGSLFGFAIAATSIVWGLSGSDRLEALREDPYYKTLWNVFISTIKWLGFATVVVLIALVFDRKDSPVFALFYSTLLTTLLVSLRLWRCIWVLQKLIEIIAMPSKARPGGREHTKPKRSRTKAS